MYIDQGQLSKKGLREYDKLCKKAGPFDYEALASFNNFATPESYWNYKASLRKHLVLQRILAGVGNESSLCHSDWVGVSDEMLKVCGNLAEIVLNLEDQLEEVISRVQEWEDSH